MEFELKPCPFCGKQPEFINSSTVGFNFIDTWGVGCCNQKCFIETSTFWYKYKFLAVNDWNWRYDE